MTQKAFTTYHKQDCIFRVAVETKKDMRSSQDLNLGLLNFNANLATRAVALK